MPRWVINLTMIRSLVKRSPLSRKRYADASASVSCCFSSLDHLCSSAIWDSLQLIIPLTICKSILVFWYKTMPQMRHLSRHMSSNYISHRLLFRFINYLTMISTTNSTSVNTLRPNSLTLNKSRLLRWKTPQTLNGMHLTNKGIY